MIMLAGGPDIMCNIEAALITRCPTTMVIISADISSLEVSQLSGHPVAKCVMIEWFNYFYLA